MTFFLVVNPRFKLGFNQGINVWIIGLTFHLVLRIRAQVTIRFLLISWTVQIVSDVDFAAVHQIDRGFEGEVEAVAQTAPGPTLELMELVEVGVVHIILNLTRSTSCLQWTRRMRSLLVIICLRCKVCVPCNLCTAADDQQEPLDVVELVTTKAWYLYSTAVQYSIVQYLPLYFFCYWSQALPSPFLLALFERHSF